LSAAWALSEQGEQMKAQLVSQRGDRVRYVALRAQVG
jgi:hypothetical protein